MTTATPTLYDVLINALQTEQYGQTFYRMAAHSAADPKGREVFMLLAEEERRHAEFLLRQARTFKATGKLDADASLGAATDLSGPTPIFSDELRGRIGEAHVEMTSLAVGIMLELSSLRFYADQAARASDPTVKAMFDGLAKWEEGHYQALLRQQEALKNAYWDEAGFAPF